jgi:hypothetical protein
MVAWCGPALAHCLAAINRPYLENLSVFPLFLHLDLHTPAVSMFFVVVFIFVIVFVIILITLVGADNGGLKALIVISNTIVVIIAAAIVIVIAAIVGVVLSVRVLVGVVNLDNRLRLGRTPMIDVGYCYDATMGCNPLIDVGYCYDVIVVVIVFNFVIVGIYNCGAIYSCNDIEHCKVCVLCCSILRAALGENLVLDGQGIMV